MITKEELDRIKALKKTNLYYAEKEYLQYIFLNAISRSEGFVFKGGNCLRICYNLGRASEDLDFSTPKSLPEVRKTVTECLLDFDTLGIRSEKTVEKEYEGNIRFEVSFRGPLFNGHHASGNSLKIDFNRSNPGWKAIVIQQLFPDVPPFTIRVMPEEEILAEKLRSLARRGQPRDLYDIWMLWQKGVRPGSALLKKKLAEEKAKLSGVRFPTKNEYESGLRELVAVLPPYEQVVEEVGDMLSKLKTDMRA